jgi:Putative zinc-finger
MNEVPDRMRCAMNELLPAYAAGSLADADRERVRAHLAGCPRCPADLAAWQAVAAAAPPADHRAPDPAELVRAVLTRSALDAAPESHPPPRRLRYLAALVLAEARLIRLAVPVASALVMALGVAFVLIPGPSSAGDLLALIAPIVAAAGVAGAYRSRRDPAAELVAATPMSGRLLLLVRLTLVLGYDLALALAASAVLAVTATDTVNTAADLNVLIGAWLGPMALLSSLSLLVAVRFGPDVALATAIGVWALRLLSGQVLVRDSWVARLIVEAWTTNAAVLGLSVALGIAAVVVAGRSGPFASEPNRGWRATHPT